MSDFRELDLEAPEADAAEQAMSADPAEDPDRTPGDSVDVPEWDAQEQSRTAAFEDDYR
jgi:hypothetical protein